jgi:L-idonate 5-dehydrogenase
VVTGNQSHVDVSVLIDDRGGHVPFNNFGAFQVVMSGIVSYPRDLAVKLGADASLNSSDKDFENQAFSLSQDGFDFVFEASASAQALTQAITVAERVTTIVQVRTLPTPVTVPLNSIMVKELNFIGEFRFANVFETALELAEAKQINLTALICTVLSRVTYKKPWTSLSANVKL